MCDPECTHTGRPEDDLRWSSLGASHLSSVKDRVSDCLGTHQTVSSVCLASPRDLPASISPASSYGHFNLFSINSFVIKHQIRLQGQKVWSPGVSDE